MADRSGGLTMTRYALAPAPRHAAMRSWDCAFCAHEDLARPVFLAPATGGPVIAAGSGCALRALAPHRGDRGFTAADERVLLADADRLTHRARADEDLLADRRIRYAAALIEFTGQDRTDGPVADSPTLLGCRQTYHQSGGYPALGLLFPEFLLAVAMLGVLPHA